ncbi:hypothetical protein HDU88_003262 [Geranomyces variabilis]|nr:hypothetical protein HDU88_003262 [Geranomyces variabilis]
MDSGAADASSDAFAGSEAAAVAAVQHHTQGPPHHSTAASPPPAPLSPLRNVTVNLSPPVSPTHHTRPSGELIRAEHVERKSRSRKIRNEARTSYNEILRFRASVIPRVLLPSILHACWATLWTVLYMTGKVRWFVIPPQLITILGVVISLLLVFRTNTAYDRYWEGRRMWGTLVTQIRNLARFAWIGVITKTEKQEIEKKGCMNLLLAFAVATKHYLRNELGHKYADLHHLLIHLPDFQPGQRYPVIKNLPLEVSFHISSYIAACRRDDLLDVSQQTAMTNALSSMVDCLTSFERIRNTPIPMAYSIHLQQSLTLYILSLPFQLVALISWGTIPVVAIAAFTMLGIDAIGSEIENPFGYDENDLPQEEYCRTTREEILRVIASKAKRDPSEWGAPYIEGNADMAAMLRSKASQGSLEGITVTVA